MGQIRLWHNLNFKKGRTKWLKCKNENLKAKMGFHVLAKHGLNKHGLKDQNWSPIWGRAQKRMGEGEEKRKRKKKKRRRGRGDQAKRYGTLDLCMELTLGMNHMNLVWSSRKVLEFQT